jgi:uncharacterized protein YkwD
MTIRYVSVVFLAAILAVIVAVGVTAVEPNEAGAALTTEYTVQTCTGGTIRLSGDEKRILDLHNNARTSRGKKALCVHPDLTEAARYHSQDMLDRGYMSHTSPDGETVKERLELFGYTFDGYSYHWYGENIAVGTGSYGSPNNIFKWWMKSKEHRRNILKDSFREVGIGVRTGTYKTYNDARAYTVDFGTRR